MGNTYRDIKGERKRQRAHRGWGPLAAFWLLALAGTLAAPLWAADPDETGLPPEVASRHTALHAADINTRREAALWLGQHGGAPSVPPLVAALQDPDQGVRVLSENSLWRIWMRSGDDVLDDRLARGSAHLQAGQLHEALGLFEEVVGLDPEFPEGYNKRATVLYYLGDYQRSLEDIAEVLKRNQHHFGALSGAGLCMMALKQPEMALHYFQRALEINPNMPGVIQMVRRLRQSERGRMM